MNQHLFEALCGLGGILLGCVLVVVCDPRMREALRDEYREWRNRR